MSIVFVVRTRFLCVEVAKGNVSVEESNGIADGRGITDGGSGFKDLSEGRGFEEGSKEKVPLEVGQGEELFRGRHREPKMGDDPSFLY